jgi:hypothetical protein
VGAAAGAALLTVALTLPLFALGISHAADALERAAGSRHRAHDACRKTVHFYDLIKGRTVAIELTYPTALKPSRRNIKPVPPGRS